MRRVRLSAAVSVDGYIAGPNGEHDWIVMDPDIDFGQMMASFDTVLIGRKTYEQTSAQGGPGMPGVQTIVFSRTLSKNDDSRTQFSDDPATTVAKLRTAPGKDLWLFGGGMLFRSFLELGLVDRVELAVIPVMLGAGIPLLPQPSRLSRLKLAGHRVYPKTGTVFLEYEPM